MVVIDTYGFKKVVRGFYHRFCDYDFTHELTDCKHRLKEVSAEVNIPGYIPGFEIGSRVLIFVNTYLILITKNTDISKLLQMVLSCFEQTSFSHLYLHPIYFRNILDSRQLIFI